MPSTDHKGSFNKAEPTVQGLIAPNANVSGFGTQVHCELSALYVYASRKSTNPPSSLETPVYRCSRR